MVARHNALKEFWAKIDAGDVPPDTTPEAQARYSRFNHKNTRASLTKTFKNNKRVKNPKYKGVRGA